MPLPWLMAFALLIAAQAPTAAVRGAMPPLDESRVPQRGQSRIMPTASGARLFVYQRTRLPLVSLRITFTRPASDVEPADKRGIAAVTAAMLREGTKAHGPAELATQMRLNGDITSSLGGPPGEDYARLSVIALTSRFPTALELLSDMLLNPAFSQEALERVRAAQIAGATAARSSRAVGRQLLQRVLDGRRESSSPTSSEPSLHTITVADIRQFHRQYYRPDDAVIFVEGDIEPDRARELIDRIFKLWRAPERTAVVPRGAAPSATAAARVHLVDRPGDQQSVLFVGGRGPSATDPDFAAFQVLHVLVGARADSRLNVALREESGYSYGIESSLPVKRDSTQLILGASVKPTNTADALALMIGRLRALSDQYPVTADELQRAKRVVADGILLRQDESAAAVVEPWVRVGLPADHYLSVLASVDRLTVADVTRVAARYLDPQRLTVVVTGDRKTIEAPIRDLNLGNVALVDEWGRQE